METMQQAIKGLRQQRAYAREQDKWAYLRMMIVDGQREFRLTKSEYTIYVDPHNRNRTLWKALNDLCKEGYITVFRKRSKGVSYAIAEFTPEGKHRADAWWKKLCNDHYEGFMAELQYDGFEIGPGG